MKYKSPYETLAVMLLVQKINFLCGREVVRTGSESRSHGLADQYNVKVTTVKKATIHQVTTMLTATKNVLLPGHSHLLTTGTDDLCQWHLDDNKSVRSSGPVAIVGGYDLQIRHF